jgi:hypothetical protein
MKRLVVTALLATAVSVTAGIGKNARIDINGARESINLTPEAKSSGCILENPGWIKDADKKRRYLHFSSPELDSDWQEVEFSFTPDKDGTATLMILGQWYNEKAGAKSFNVFFKKVEIVTGASLKNGDFSEKDKSGYPTGWKVSGKSPVPLPIEQGGATLVKLQFNTRLSQDIQVKAGQPITIKATVKLADVAAVTGSNQDSGLLVDVVFGKDCQARDIVKKGRFVGPLPTRVKADFPGWNTSRVTSEKHQENGREFLRFNVKNLDYAVLLRLAGEPITVPDYYKLEVTCRCPDGPLNLHIRQLPRPYKTFKEVDAPKDSRWQTHTFAIHLTPPNSFFHKKMQYDTSRMALYLSLKPGVTDIASVTLSRLDRQAYVAALNATIERPASEPGNYFRNSRFPLGPQSGWNAYRTNITGTVAADPTVPGPSGVASLRIQSEHEPIIVYAEPIQVADPGKKLHVSFAYKSAGGWHAKMGTTSLKLPPSDTWKTAAFSVNPDPLAKGFQLSLAGQGTLHLDSLMAYSGERERTYVSAGDCEIALAPTGGELAGTRLLFADQPAEVQFAATGEFAGAVLKGQVVNVYGEARSLPEYRLGRSRLKRLLNAAVPAQQLGTLDVGLFPQAPLGPFRIEVWAERDGRRISPVSEMVVIRIRRPVYWGKDAPNSPFGNHFLPRPRVLTTMKAAGINWTRFNDANMQSTCWGWLEKEKGKWTFQDETIYAFRKANLKILGQLGTAPTWASYYHGVKSSHYFDYTYQPKDIEAFKNYIRTVASRYKGVIDEYQFQNEPWGATFWHKAYDPKTGTFDPGKTPAEDYAKLAKIACRELKDVCPEATFYGFNSHGGKKGIEWTKTLYDSEAYSYCDFIDYHYYNASGERTLFPGDCVETACQSAVGYIRQQTPPPLKPIVNSEANPMKSGAVPNHNMGKNAYTGLLKHTLTWTPKEDTINLADVTCRFIASHLTLPVKRLFLYSDHCYHHLLHAPSFTVLLGADGYPHPTLAAFSNLAWLLEDRQFAKRISVGDQVWAYLFEGRGKTIAVISGKLNGTYTIPQNSELEVLGLYGNKRTGEVRYNNQLLYVSSALSADELAKSLSSSAD